MKIIITYIIISLSTILTLSSQVNEIQKIQAENLSEDDRFGLAVAVSDTCMLIGSPGDDENGVNAGAVYSYKKRNDVWQKQSKLVSNDIQAGDFFGYVINISGDYAVISTPITNSYAGAAYVFHFENNDWVQQAKLTASDASANSFFGYSNDISDNYVIVGAYGDNTNGNNAGAVYIFQNNTGIWTEVAKITASDGDTDNQFGISVGISGDYAVVGSPGNKNLSDVTTGTAYILKNDVGTWSELQKIESSDGTLGDHFGNSVAICQDRAVIGADYKTGTETWSGAIYIFNNNADNWTENQKLTAQTQVAQQHFGQRVAIQQNNIVVGAPGQVSFTPYVEGSAFVYNFFDGSWVYVSELQSSDNTDQDVFGYSVAISDKDIIVGAQMNDTQNSNAGSVYNFDVFVTEIIVQPVSEINIETGNDTTISVSATGTNLTYQWQKNNINLTDGANISGVNTDSLKITSITNADAGAYKCVVSGTYGTVQSSNCILTIPAGISNFSEKQISIYPNPTTGIVNFDFKTSAGLLNVEITNIAGKIVKQLSISNKKSTINLENQPAGIYFIKIQTNEGIFINKIIKN